MGGYIKIKDHHSPAEAEIGTELGKKISEKSNLLKSSISLYNFALFPL